ncbi:MAG: PepSY domain-containing protein [Candidatus Aminicenantes bacterium]|nr:PepSY domain-containing protein [Candidatus Aminicenantes bacterium]
MKNFAKVLGAVLVLALLVPVIGTAQRQEKKERNAASDAKALAGAAKVTLAAALDKALKAAPGTVLSGELEQEKNMLIFTFDILPKLTSEEITEIHVDAKTGAVVKAVEETEKEEVEGKKAEAAEGAEEPSIADMQSLAKTAKVTMAAALQTALKAAPGTALAAELENEAGLLIFSFDILPSPSATELKEVHVDAKTGLVIKTEIEK